MSFHKFKKILTCLFGSLMLSGMVAVAADFAAAWLGWEVPCSLFLLGAAALTAVFYLLFRRRPKNAVKTALSLLAVLCVTAAGLFVCWRSFTEKAVFESVDRGKEQLYAGKKVMLIVPHQDDDINVLGGVMEEYVRYGSSLYPVFVTNGDAEGLAEERCREALEVFRYIGVPEENVIFLGYGDTWKEGGPHLYNALPDQVMESAFGRRETYGTSAGKAYREGRAYTVDNLLEDLESVILEYRPDVIFCSDYDYHIDHRAGSMAFEKAMGSILKRGTDYRPLVFKGYAYSTAWYAEADFYEINILSTQNVFAEPYGQEPAVYRWEERLRLPVWDHALSRSLFSSRIYDTLALYSSQEAVFHAGGIINGDKVVWYRDTNSLCYEADIQVSSGDGSLLNDFMLIEHTNLLEENRLPCDGTWIPTDGEKRAAVTFPEPVTVTQVRLYDNPSPEDNVLAGSIVFDDGSEVKFGPLDPGGAAMTVQTDKASVTGFSVILTDTEGSGAGLTEIEAFSGIPDHGLRYLKLTDREGNFVYDYWLPDGSETYLELYSCGVSREERSGLQLNWDNQKCWAEWENGRIWIICPEGKTMTLTVSTGDGGLSDTVRIHNPGKLTRAQYAVSQTLEEQIFQKYCDGAHRRSATYKLLVTALDFIM